MAREQTRLHTLIVGGGIGGLTLANALEAAGLSYTLFERRADIAPHVGASLGTTTAGARILDQLGCYDAVEALEVPLSYARHYDRDGRDMRLRGDEPLLQWRRSGYRNCFLNRQNVLQILYDNLRDKSRVLVGTQIEQVEVGGEDVTVVTANGDRHCGHVLVGCDGVNSRIRYEMWKLADRQSPGLIPESEKQSMTAEYQCMFGISTHVAGLDGPGMIDLAYDEGRSVMLIVSKNQRAYWFAFRKLNRKYLWHEIPKYSREDGDKFVDEMADVVITPTTTLGDLFGTAQSRTLVALEEAQYKTWTAGPIACVGDAVVKVTPNAGSGGGSAIESAAALANQLKALHDKQDGIPRRKDIEAALTKYQQSREYRAHAIAKGAAFVTRMQALDTRFHKLFVYFVMPYFADLLCDLQSDEHSGAIMLDFRPPPQRSRQGHMPFNPRSGMAAKESRLWRLLLATPMLLITGLAAWQAFSAAHVSPHNAMPVMTLWRQDTSDLLRPPTLNESFTNVERLLHWMTPLSIASISSHDVWVRAKAVSYMADYGVVYTVLLVEGARRANALTLLQLPIVFGFAVQVVGFGRLAGVWFTLTWPLCQIDNFKSIDHRLTDVRYSTTILAGMGLCYYLPGLLQVTGQALQTRYTAASAYLIFPLALSIAQRLAALVLPDTVVTDRLYRPLCDLRMVIVQVATTAVVAAGTWIGMPFVTGHRPVTMFIPIRWHPRPGDQVTLQRAALQWDEFLGFTACFMWLAYSFWDLKCAGMVRHSWLRMLVMLLALMTVFGPGATFACGWLYREYCLAYRRHKDAIVGSGPGHAACDGLSKTKT